MTKRSILAAGMAAFVLGLGLTQSAMAGDSCGSSHAKETKAQAASMTKTDQAGGSIVDVAIGAGTFQSLVAAVKAAGLEETLRGKGPFTVFAPSDEAFAKLPEGTLTALLKDKAKLAQILTFHVVSGRLTAADVLKLKDAKTVQGQKVVITAGESPMVNNARIVATDIAANNGVIHVIDTVILPQL